jgi:Flp pilus assembly pilin Flp
MKTLVQDFCTQNEGQDLIEYSLLMALLALIAVGLAHGALTGVWATPHHTPPAARTMAS